mmetsp:Transcript_2718/g.5471  ORF Transcript_2718/g.5471 Transcript_2718/m.5471 type:complete len:178 (-) Transcript_2718:68-601(-)
MQQLCGSGSAMLARHARTSRLIFQPRIHVGFQSGVVFAARAAASRVPRPEETTKAGPSIEDTRPYDDAYAESEKERLSMLSNLYLEVLEKEEESRIERTKAAIIEAHGATYHEVNHHWNRTNINGLESPRALGVHLTHAAHRRYRRGCRGNWGLKFRSVGRVSYRYGQPGGARGKPH